MADRQSVGLEGDPMGELVEVVRRERRVDSGLEDHDVGDADVSDEGTELGCVLWWRDLWKP